MKVEIIEFDNDYNAYCGSTYEEFASLKEANEYCNRKDWSGYSYSVGWYEKEQQCA